jgi:hypothetical protein
MKWEFPEYKNHFNARIYRSFIVEEYDCFYSYSSVYSGLRFCESPPFSTMCKKGKA